MDPYTMLTIGKSVVGFMEAKRAADEQNALHQRNWQASAQARDIQIQGLNRRAIQEAEAAAGQQFELQIAALQEAESRKVNESGFVGQTEALKIADVEARKLRASDVIDYNVNATLEQIEDQKLGVNAQMLNRINSVPQGQQPSLIGHTIGAVASAYAAEKDVTGKSLFGGLSKAKAAPNFVAPALGSTPSLVT
jgi:hypothetical protein